MTFNSLLAPVLIAALAAFTPAIADEPKEVPKEVPEEEAGPSAIDALLGDSKRCINLNRIDRTEVLNDRTIVFYLRGGEIYVNRLPHRCPGLRSRDTFMYKNTTNSLCNVDTIRVMDSIGGTLRPGVGCGLGEFHPVSEITVEQLKAVDDKGS